MMIKVPDNKDGKDGKDAILIQQYEDFNCFHILIYHKILLLNMIRVVNIQEFYDVLNDDINLILNIDHEIYSTIARYCITNKIKYYMVRVMK